MPSGDNFHSKSIDSIFVIISLKNIPKLIYNIFFLIYQLGMESYLFTKDIIKMGSLSLNLKYLLNILFYGSNFDKLHHIIIP